jgi:hypothetical protein
MVSLGFAGLAWHKLRVARRALAGLGLLCCAPLVQAQVSEHQRLAVEAAVNWEADIEWTNSLSVDSYVAGALPDLQSSLALSLLVDRKWSLGLEVPVYVLQQPEVAQAWLIVPGDVSASAGWTGRSAAHRLRGNLGVTGPSGIWLGGQEVPGVVAGGSGRWTVGLSGGVSRIMDPLVLGASLSWQVGLPRPERWDRTWRPGDFALGLTLTEVFNEHVSWSAVLTQSVLFPEIPWGSMPGSVSVAAVSYDASAVVRVTVQRGSSSVGVGVSKGLVYTDEPASIEFSAGYMFRQKEER